MKFLKILFLFLIITFSPTLNAFTLEEKIGQMLIVHFNGTEANHEAERLIKEGHAGGFIYYNWSNGLHSPEQIKKLSQGLQQMAMDSSTNIPLWICVDQEGGPVVRCKEGFTQLPGNRLIAQTGLPERAKESALISGQELSAAGVNMNLAPVVDVSSNPAASYIAKRTYGNTPDQVIAYAERALEGYRQSGILAVIKHFPGYGNVVLDPHEDLPIVKKTLKELMEVDLLPFIQLASKADAIMTAHIMLPEIDPENCATLSKTIIQGILRENIQYKGLVISDSLVMQGLLNNCNSIEEAAIQAIAAGTDLLILGGKQINSTQQGLELTVEDDLRIHRAIVEAVKQGRISMDRIEDAFQRILNMKKKYGPLIGIGP